MVGWVVEDRTDPTWSRVVGAAASKQSAERLKSALIPVYPGRLLRAVKG